MAISAGQNSQEEGAGGAQHEPVGSEPNSVAERDDVWLDLVVERLSGHLLNSAQFALYNQAYM